MKKARNVGVIYTYTHVLPASVVVFYTPNKKENTKQDRFTE